eukprot:514855-Hanusia_phi.AAC.1
MSTGYGRRLSDPIRVAAHDRAAPPLSARGGGQAPGPAGPDPRTPGGHRRAARRGGDSGHAMPGWTVGPVSASVISRSETLGRVSDIRSDQCHDDHPGRGPN